MSIYDPHALPGLLVGEEATTTDGPPRPVIIPEEVLDRHCLITGQTGAGKSSTATHGIRTGHTSTDGATIVLDPKGDGWPDMIGRALYHDRGVYGSRDTEHAFEDVLYFDSEIGLPQAPLFDIRPQLDAGVSRIDAVTAVIDDLLTTLEIVFEGDDDAVRAPDVIRNLVMALFDPKYGTDAFELSTLYDAVITLKTERTVPEASPEWLKQLTESLTSGPDRLFRAIAEGAQTRVEKLFRDPYLRAMFDSIPETSTDGFRLHRWLDEDVVIIIDLSEITPRAQRTIANTLLFSLWRALRSRQAALGPREEPALVTLWIDEVPQLRVQRVLSELLAMGRGFGCAVIPLLQFPQQLRAGGSGMGDRSYRELLTNVGSVLSGQVMDAPGLAEKLAVRDRSPAETQALLGECPDDRWIVSPATDRSLPTQQSPTAVINEPPLPPGHPNGPAPFTPSVEADFADAWSRLRDHTHDHFGVTPTGYHTPEEPQTPAEDIERGLRHTLWVDSQSLPEGVEYATDRDNLRCADCGSRFSPRFERLVDAIGHCQDSTEGDVESLPITDIWLEDVTVERVRACPLSIAEIMFLRLIERARRRAIDPRAWDVRTESMYPLRAAVGLIGSEPKEKLAEEQYISVQSELQGDYFRLTSKGRALLQQLRNGGDPPEPKRGDPEESVLHIKGVERAVQALETVRDEPGSPIEQVERYWVPPESEARIDVVGLDSDGQPHICVEVERKTHHLSTGVVNDADAMAACDPNASLWVVTNRKLGHNVVDHLANPDTGRPRIDLDPGDKLSQTTTLAAYDFAAPGCSDLVTYGQLDAQTIRDAIDF